MKNKIIVIDDEQHFLDSVRRVLNTAGFRDVELETDPANAIAIFERGDPIDLALIDVSMPGISGIEVLESIMRTSPDTECLMITAVNDAKVAVQCIKKGAYDYLLKPISRDDLVLAVNRALERKRLLGLLDIKKTSDASHLKCVEAFEPIITRSINLLRIMKEAELHAVREAVLHPLIGHAEGLSGERLRRKREGSQKQKRQEQQRAHASHPGWPSGKLQAAHRGLRPGRLRRRSSRSRCGGPSPSCTDGGCRSGSDCPRLRIRALPSVSLYP